MKMKSFVLIVASISSIHANAANADPISDFIYKARAGYGICSHKGAAAASLAELKSITGKGGEPDYGDTRACRVEHGKMISESYKSAQKAATNNKAALAELKNMHQIWFNAMSSAITPTGSDTDISFEKRMNETNRALREAGNKILQVVCKQDFECIDKRSQKLNDLDSLL